MYDRSDGTSCRWKRAAVISVVLAITGGALVRFGAVARSQGVDAGAERADRLEAMEALARSVAVTEVASVGGGRTPVAMRPKPLHRWNEPTRRSHDGTLWAWGRAGRPLVLFSLEHYPHPSFKPVWSYELVSLSDGLVGATGATGYARLTADYLNVEGEGLLPWTTEKRGVTLRPFPCAPVPGGTEGERLRQSKVGFSAEMAPYHGFTAGRWYNPMHRYNRAECRLALGVARGGADLHNDDAFAVFFVRRE